MKQVNSGVYQHQLIKPTLKIISLTIILIFPIYVSAAPLGLDYVMTKDVCGASGEAIKSIMAPTNVWVEVRANTLQLGGKVNLSSNNRNVFPMKNSIQIAGMGGSFKTLVKVKAPRSPTPVMIMASMLPGNVDQKMWPVMVYPKLKIASFQLSPKKSIYNVGERVTATIKLSYSPPKYNTGSLQLKMTPPKLVSNSNYQGAFFQDFKYDKEWYLDWTKEKDRTYKKTFTMKWISSGATMSNLSSLSYTMNASFSRSGTCLSSKRVSTTDSKTISFAIRNPKKSAPSINTPTVKAKKRFP